MRTRTSWPAHLRHAVDSTARPSEPHARPLERAQRPSGTGKVGRFGVGAESERAAIDRMADEGVDVVQLPFGVLDRETLDGVRSRQRGRTVEIWARAVLGCGVLSSSMRRLESVEDHPTRAVIEQLESIATDAGMALDEPAIRWATGKDEVGLILLGMTTIDHLTHNVVIAEPDPLRRAVLGARLVAQPATSCTA